ncbi:putative stage III sporulation protein AG [Marvinbryantia formatexigens DSM 14469]|uniref:Stage III sporulation protein AG n=1 Tax=Marvinbryantia formatexigens DSM 14469 TaxID=478749 RepID=C6LAD3_9FIRM|nr:hypothetical protein [Marvinbryantia formatexigens]EET62540.1 putative stage III sporulation protein AG [Marvinbryantia formatexigens DSM 14469]UWO24939.1 stage III sporulation protein AG [Marvinbryantia formatexigens DSM 14469]SDG24546.1 stage III sporulation protein AG [Marvinbryantia formatexigens]
MNKIYQWLEKLKNMRRDQWIVLLLAGVLILVISLPVETGTDADGKAAAQEKAGVDMSGETEDVRDMEQRLENILSELDGAGQVRVMIYCRDSGERIVEKDTATVRRVTQEDGGDGAGSSTTEEEERPETVYGTDGSGGETPYVTRELSPQIEGVLVLAQGADSSLVKKDITDAVMALFGLEAHKIKVMKMN